MIHDMFILFLFWFTYFVGWVLGPIAYSYTCHFSSVTLKTYTLFHLDCD